VGTSAAAHGPSRLRTWLACAAVAAAAATSYVSTLDAWFVGDDFGLITVLHDKPPLHFFTLFTGSWTDDAYGVTPDELRPFLALSYQLDAQRGAATPRPYHTTSIALHVLCALLVVALARVAAGATDTAAAVAGLWFAVHPSHSEAVAWISGRADSIPALFLMATLLAYAAWRRRPRAAAYVMSLLLFLCALFSKQSAITMPAVLLAFELLLQGRRGRPVGRWLAPVVPFAGLTAGYLILRQVLFGNFVREQTLTLEQVGLFLSRQAAYVDALFSAAIVASPNGTPRGRVLLALAVAGTGALALHAWRHRDERVRALLFFGPVWYLLTVGPLVVTYFSTRHLYLPSAGLAVAWGAMLDLATQGRRARWRVAGAAACAAIVFAYAHALHRHNRRWNEAARVSLALTTEAQRVARSAPEGSLLVIDAPWRTRYAYVWAWAVPFAMQPPFAETDLTRRVGVVSHSWAYCCPPPQWLADLQQRLGAWSARPSPSYVVWTSAPGPVAHTASSTQAAGLDTALRAVASAPTPDEAESRLQNAVALALRAPR
jgi:hypothetical protein